MCGCTVTGGGSISIDGSYGMLRKTHYGTEVIVKGEFVSTEISGTNKSRYSYLRRRQNKEILVTILTKTKETNILRQSITSE